MKRELALRERKDCHIYTPFVVNSFHLARTRERKGRRLSDTS